MADLPSLAMSANALADSGEAKVNAGGGHFVRS
jgi:hypothetical protein